MFETDIKINGVIVAHIYGYNSVCVNKNVYNYFFRYYEPDTGFIQEGSVLHKRDDGIYILISKILLEVKKH